MKRLAFGACLAIYLSIIPCFGATVPGQTFPYVNVTLNLAPMEMPFPGIGTQYCSLAKGIETALWNPATLTSVKKNQTVFSYINEVNLPAYNYKFNSEDKNITFADNTNFSANFYFTDAANATSIATRENIASALYSANSTGTKFKQAFNFNDNFVFGLITQTSFGGSLDLVGNFNAIAKTNANFYNSSGVYGSGVSVNNLGYLTMVHTTEGGSSFNYTTTSPLWTRFLSQQSDLPLTVMAECKNDLQVNPGMTISSAYKWDKLSIGANITPMTANLNINNNFRAIIKDGTTDIIIYQPNFDATDSQSALNWVTNPGLYGSESGYTKSVVNVPEGQPIAEAIYKGFYQASAVRNDLGFRYEVNDNFSVALAFENFNGAGFDFNGQGIASYARTRVSTAEPPALTPGNTFEWDLFTDEFTSIEGLGNFTPPTQYKVNLPKRTKLGLAVLKPILIALDYEQQSSPIAPLDPNSTEDIFTNIRNLKIGVEMPFFNLITLSGGTNLMFKPDVSNPRASTTDSLNKLFKFGVLPMSLDLGLGLNLADSKIRTAVGVNGNSLLSLYQLDALNQDSAKLAYINISYSKDAWSFGYLMAADPGSSLNAYANRTNKADKEIKMEYFKWINTFNVSFTY